MKIKNKDNVNNIIKSLLKCRFQCEGIHMVLNEKKEIKDGIIPRSLWLDESNEPSSKTCIILGINPGKAPKEERKEYTNYENIDKLQSKYNDFYNNLTKETANQLMNLFNKREETHKKSEKGKKHNYFIRSKNLANKLGYENILWSNLCKCQNSGKELPPVQTFRTCMNLFLREEMKLFHDVLIIAAGNKAYEIVSYMFPNRFVIGIPHPTGNFPFFSHLFEDNTMKTLRREYVDLVKEKVDKNSKPNSILFNPLKSYFITKKTYEELSSKKKDLDSFFYKKTKKNAKIKKTKVEGYYFKILNNKISKLKKYVNVDLDYKEKDEIEIVHKKTGKVIEKKTVFIVK